MSERHTRQNQSHGGGGDDRPARKRRTEAYEQWPVLSGEMTLRDPCECTGLRHEKDHRVCPYVPEPS